jgi:signal transduction histidine kinase
MEKLKQKILLVDDEEDIREVLRLALADVGYDVRVAENGEEALTIFHQERPPVILTDIKMPGLDGIELLRKIKIENPDTEVIMITGHGDMDLAIKSLKFEAADFITKPINVDILEIALNKVQEKILIRKKLAEYTENLEALVREKAALQDHLASLGLMIGSISHSLKGLLTGLDAGIYLLESGLSTKDKAQTREGWETVKQMVGRIKKTILDILFYAKDRGLKFQKVGILDFAVEVAAVIENAAAHQQINFEKKFEVTDEEFEVDAETLQSAIINMLENALDACQQDNAKDHHQIDFGVRLQQNTVVFQIEDNGSGMDDETQSKMFSLFFSEKGEGGTGLGLFIAKRVIQKHCGDILVDSTPGSGTRIRVTVPKEASPEVPA